jgi:hypothetical protein
VECIVSVCSVVVLCVAVPHIELCCTHVSLCLKTCCALPVMGCELVGPGEHVACGRNKAQMGQIWADGAGPDSGPEGLYCHDWA